MPISVIEVMITKTVYIVQLPLISSERLFHYLINPSFSNLHSSSLHNLIILQHHMIYHIHIHIY